MKPSKFVILLSLILLITFSNNLYSQGLKGDKDKKESHDKNKKSSSSWKSSGSYNYKTSLGLRGGFTSGLTLKHFINGNTALEGIIGTRWHGFSLAGLYELHKSPALGISKLSWEFGGGVRIGSYNEYYYTRYNGDPYYRSRNIMTIGVVGIFGLEYQFNEIPFTVGLDLMPYFDFVGRGDNFVDGSISFRYIFK